MSFEDQVKKGFTACKGDIEDLKIENITLKSKISTLESQNQTLSSKMDELLGEIKGLSKAIEFLKNSQDNIQKEVEIKPQVIEKPIQQIKQPKIQDPYEALLAFKAKANKREVLKQKLLSMIGESGMNLSELKFMFVDHFKYCSKATFYNYLKELELEKTVKIERENSKNFIYITSLRREI